MMNIFVYYSRCDIEKMKLKSVLIIIIIVLTYKILEVYRQSGDSQQEWKRIKKSRTSLLLLTILYNILFSKLI